MDKIKELLKEIVREVVNEEIIPRLDTIQRLLIKSPLGRTYTTKQAEELLGCNKATLWRWAKEGKLVPVKRGGQNLYRHEDIERFIYKTTTNLNTATMTPKEYRNLLKEGKTIEEILALRGESAKELLEKRGKLLPCDVLLEDEDSLEELTQTQLQSLLEAIDNFSVGNYDYIPKEEIPIYNLDEIKETIQSYNNCHLSLHILENLSEE